MFERRYDFSPVNEFFTEIVVGTFLKIAPFLATRPELLQLQFAHAPLGDAADYALGEGIAVVFGKGANRILVRKRDLRIPLIAPSRTSRLLMQATLDQQQLQQDDLRPTQLQALHTGQPLAAAQVAPT